MLDHKAWLVAQREVLENIRTKAFWIGIFVFPIILTLAVVVPAWLEGARSARLYTVVDHSDWLLDAVDQRAAMPDLEKVFSHLMATEQQDPEAFAELPAALQQTAEQLRVAIDMVASNNDELSDQEVEGRVVEGFAATISGLSGPRGEALKKIVPAQAMAELEGLRDAVRVWWKGLPADEAETFGGAVTKDRYVRVENPSLEGEDLIEALNQQVADEELFAYFVIDPDPVHAEKAIKYVSANLTDEDLRGWFGDLASSAVREQRLAEKEIDPQVAQWVQEPLDFEVKRVGSKGEEEVDDQARVRQWAPAVFVYLLWVSVFSISQMLLTNTIEEKSNRIMEVLLSSISPLQLMVGKIGGIAMTGLTMVSAWVIFFVLLVKGLPLAFGLEMGFDLSGIAADPLFLTSFIAYFLLGYLFYAAVLVAIGSVCNSLKEAQNLMAPVSVLLMVPLLTLIPITQDPNGSLAKFLSFVPPFTPFVMMNRAAGPPAGWEYLATTGVLIVSLGLVMWAAAKIFRIGILMTGKPPRLGEILRWIRAPVGVVPERVD